jgi:hypothetical protein
MSDPNKGKEKRWGIVLGKILDLPEVNSPDVWYGGTEQLFNTRKQAEAKMERLKRTSIYHMRIEKYTSRKYQ